MAIRIGIFGYGNLGKGIECAIKHNPDLELKAVFTRRNPDSVKILTEGVKVCSAEDAPKWKDEIDVMILCGGSATDLPVQTPKLAEYFNVVDSFDTHARIPEHFAAVDEAAKKSGHVGMISVGWDPGMFSLNRLYANCILPGGHDYTFWGKGVSQGHSDAIRRIAGVKDARQYTIPVESALEAGDNIGALLRGIQRSDIQRGQVLCKPGSIHPYTKFSGQVYVLKKEEGGRHTPFFNNYRPQFYFRTTDVTGVCELPAGTEMCMPGDNVEMTIELIHPVAMEQGLTFAIREGGRTVGSGRVATVIE